MAKTKEASAEVKTDVKAEKTQHPHFKNGHNWLAWITGLTAVWMIVTFIVGLNGETVISNCYKYLNTWYLVNLAVIILIALYSTFALLKKCSSLIFWSSSLFYVMTLQAVSLVILYFYQEDVATINALVMFVWSIAWYGYLVGTGNVESDYPRAHRSHSMFGTVVLAVMTLSTIAYGVMVCFNLLW